MGADGLNNAIDNELHSSLDFLPDSIKEIVSNKRFIIYYYGHYGTTWSLIYEEADSYNIKTGTTRNKPLNLGPKIDTENLMDSSKDLICWGMDTLPYITKDMAREYPQLLGFYHSLSVFDQKSNCIFNSNNSIGFEGCDNMALNDNFLRLSYLMYWLSAPEIRSMLPGFEDYIQ
jgi:hypothetical protein